MDKFSKIELLAYIKKFNKKNENKIINIDKLKKKELYDICLNYNLLSISHDNNDIVINYKNVSKDHILQNIELYFLKQNLTMPSEFEKRTKKDLIDFVELNSVPHYTPDIIKKEIKEIEKKEFYKQVIIYNILRYDNIDVKQINDNETYVNENNLDTDLTHMKHYARLLKTIYEGYYTFCNDIGVKYKEDKFKSFPKIISILKSVSK
jgi:hypothetical protein